tara:strand:- start:495 stop:929 length:435 start_codon:yes stop_codon:yes gene_type:complete
MRISVMLNEKCDLPNEIVRDVMSYTFPNVKEQHKSVVRQINYNYEEYNYLRGRPHNFYGGFRECDFRYFILKRALDKIEMNYNTDKRRERKQTTEFIVIQCNAYMLYFGTNHDNIYPMPEEEANFPFPAEDNLLANLFHQVLVN